MLLMWSLSQEVNPSESVSESSNTWLQPCAIPKIIILMSPYTNLAKSKQSIRDRLSLHVKYFWYLITNFSAQQKFSFKIPLVIILEFWPFFCFSYVIPNSRESPIFFVFFAESDTGVLNVLILQPRHDKVFLKCICNIFLSSCSV